MVPFSSLFDSIFNSGLAKIRSLKILKNYILAFDDSIATDLKMGKAVLYIEQKIKSRVCYIGHVAFIRADRVVVSPS